MDERPLRPNAEFVDRLEWQLRREMRRRDRLEPETRWPRFGRPALRAVALIVLSLLAGYATATATQEMESRAERRYLVAAAEGQVELAELRARFIEERIDEVARRVRQGEIEAQALAAARFEGEQVAVDLERARLELEEIRLAGTSPRHDLTAPLAAGRDFVSERLQLEVRLLDLRAETMLAAVRSVAGAEEAAKEARWVEYEIGQVKSRKRELTEALEKRRQFVAGEIDGQRLLAEEQFAAARGQVSRADEQLQMAREQLDVSRQRVASAETDAIELAWAEYTLASAEINARLARMQLQMAREKIGQ